MEDYSVEVVRLVYMRVCRIYFLKKSYISLVWVVFEERYGMYFFCDFMNLIVILWCVFV